MTDTDRLAQFQELALECSRSYLASPAGEAHLAAYAEQRRTAQAHYATVATLDAQGLDITDAALTKLLPHAPTPAHRQQGAWISVAPAILGDIRTWYVAAGWLRPDAWPAVARGLWTLIRRAVSDPTQLDDACRAFAAQPEVRGFQAGMVSPILAALRPDDYHVVNAKSRAVLAYCTGRDISPALVDYPASNAALAAFIAGQPILATLAHTHATRADDLFDLLCHWIVAVRRFPLRTPAVWRLHVDDDPGLWAEWQEGHYIGLGWDELGDLSDIPQGEFAQRRTSLLAQYPAWRKADLNQVWRLARHVREGDQVIVTHAAGHILGAGTVAGPYYYVAEGGLAHRRPVEWDDLTPRRSDLPDRRGLTKLTQDAWAQARAAPPLPAPARAPAPATASPAARRLAEPAPAYAAPTPQPAYPLEECAAATGLPLATLQTWLAALERKGQAVLYGPPGTGKTFVAHHLARHLVSGGDGFVEVVQFHPAYSYEDFVQGLRPQPGPQGITFVHTPGRFVNFCRRAAGCTGPCVLVIDEFNRANLPQVLGELLYLLEYRAAQITLAGSDTPFAIPANVRILATMNTADRAIALVDHALRRRFAFLPLFPNPDLIRHYHARHATGYPVEPLISLLAQVNAAIGDPHMALGISYFLRLDLATALPNIWQLEIEPYLEELFFDQPDQVAPLRWDAVRGMLP